MARSLWKGKVFIKDFIKPAYKLSNINYFKSLKPLNSINISSTSLVDELKIYRRNHLILNSQAPVIQALSPYFLYNGYDFIKRNITLALVDETPVILNLATTVSTREMQVNHKIKLSKAARKNNAKLKKRVSTLTKTHVKNSLVRKKASLSKTIKK